MVDLWPLIPFLQKPLGFADIPTWCSVCDNNQDRGCGALAAAANHSTVSAVHEHHFSAVGAGFIGAGVTLAVLFGALALLSFTGFVKFGKKNRHAGVTLGSDVCICS